MTPSVDWTAYVSDKAGNPLFMSQTIGYTCFSVDMVGQIDWWYPF